MTITPQSPARSFNRSAADARPCTITINTNRYAEGACIIETGHTKIHCTATIDERVPPFLRGAGKGWVTAEYGMLPRATHSRSDRKRQAEAGRTQEISRLIGRSLRAVTDLDALGERQIIIDCDVLQADGGTRTAAITGGYVALALALRALHHAGGIATIPLKGEVAAISCGLVSGACLCDLDYEEDSAAALDANFVMDGKGGLIEIQATGEQGPFAEDQFQQILAMAKTGIHGLVEAQRRALAQSPTL